jgi:site-specific DNA-methyltransferase (adenine-specific)
MADNVLYYGDNLDILKRYVKDESVDLVYLDPPFNSNVDYNVLFQERDGTEAASQIKAFKDTWTWTIETEAEYQRTVEECGQHRVVTALSGLRQILGQSDMMAYLTMMAARLVEIRRVMKPTASLYLHCDPTASHYLKLLLDATIGPAGFLNEIVWRRTGSHGKVRRYGPVHDTLLFYANGPDFVWNNPVRPYMKAHVEEYFIRDTGGWRSNYYGNVLTGSGTRGGESGKKWRDFDPTSKGRHWAIPSKLLREVEEDISELSVLEKLEWLYQHKFIEIREGEAWPIYTHYLREGDGQALSDIWAYQPYTEGLLWETPEGIDADVRWLSTRDKERLGYPTQKPVGLLERIINASSNPGDTVLDPFCGCGTTVDAAQKLDRKWIGIDITHLAITLINKRLLDTHGEAISARYEVVGQPKDVAGARALAKQDRFQFQWWALDLVHARPYEQKKGADQGIDGRLYFHDESESGKTKQIIISVKSGKLKATDVRDLRAVIDREQAAIGVLISLEDFSGPMRAEAASAGFYDSPWGGKHPRLQLLTIQDLFDGKKIDMPPVANVTFKKAPKAKPKKRKGKKLAFDGELEY